jgi:hypothetical protein
MNVNNPAELTIEEGVTIQFPRNAGGLTVADGAVIKAVGTDVKPIKFIGPTNEKGSWVGVTISSVLSNKLDYVEIHNAGRGTSDYSSAVYVYGGKVDMTNCLIDRSASNGITLQSYSSSWSNAELRTFSKNKVTNCDKAPIYTYSYTSCWSLRNLANDNTFTGNTNEYIHNTQTMNYRIDGDMTLHNLGGYPWYFAGGLDISADREFTVEKGTVILMGSGRGIDIPSKSHFIAVGTAADPITIKGLRDDAGFWQYITVNSNTPGSKFEYCNISAGGSGQQGALIYYYEKSYIEIYNCKLSKSLAHGVVCGYSNPTINVMYNAHLKHADVTFDAIGGSVFRISSPAINYTTMPDMTAGAGSYETTGVQNGWWMSF